MTHRRGEPELPSGDALVRLLLSMYCQGIFPMADSTGGDINWYTADPRAIIPLNSFHVPATVERVLSRGRFELTTDHAFADVIRGCASPRHRRASASVSKDTWINGTIVEWFTELHRAGAAHSLEAWRTDPASGERLLVGGVYGVTAGAAFFAESMFHVSRPRRPDGSRDPLDGTDASNVCLVRLLRHLVECGYRLFDVQFANPHTARFGVREVAAEAYQRLLADAVTDRDRWRPLES
ncbi:MAG: leucyl/phenylalanyl-tRNA--protein transferase [Phycisphaerales bacterium]|nr:leucyl/phenylalanyl-tRNA--protein transferase [Phycisphaerales bacterium]